MNGTITRQWRNILVLGAGELGMAMIDAFVKEREQHPDISLTVLLRPASLKDDGPANQARLQRLAAWGVEVINADFSQQTAEELAQRFTPYDAIINCSGFVGGAGTQLKITQAVLAAGVDRYFPWQFGVDYDRIGLGSGQPVWDEQLAVREMLRAQRQTHWVIVSTGMFTSYLFEPGFGLVDMPRHKVHAPGDADFSLTLTTPGDIGILTAKIFFHQPVIEDEVVYIAGDTITYHGLTTLLAQHYQRPFTLEVHSHADLRQATKAAPSDVAAAYRLAFARPDGVAWRKEESYNARHGFRVTDVKQWLENNKPAD
ncbi:aromatic alcohol reductase [Sodalis sp. dw_96]|uniref:aromatic alcohol reductase n=1 Tax=Sodalis sp. dw_96 TaxID=2719794 RepID=UPI001BD6D50C|nr:aromatic alcohol reductase [Sodalis sp. dw_96]